MKRPSTNTTVKNALGKEIRRLTKTSHWCRRQFSAAVAPLVDMLRYGSVEANEAALFSLLNLAVKDEVEVCGQ
ncbi:hypothetical protein Vadar_004842 [Vaccinium darrowii]|uniref:Uncharacterized protein n=1 Tax=Vaccinium darrowii TaxID=229202 RepID=A0ACB7WXN4_9ERIC|nr:hypothetical protein Vadar_004842 [Vaccinium darrowii]